MPSPPPSHAPHQRGEMGELEDEQSHYSILGLRAPDFGTGNGGGELDSAVLKKAYHAALLAAHPDKSTASAPPSPPILHGSDSAPAPSPTIDAIKQAHTTLRDPVLRAAYNAQLQQRARERRLGLKAGAGTVQTEGLEVLDLSDFDAVEGGWGRLGSEGAGSLSPSPSADSPSAAGGDAAGDAAGDAGGEADSHEHADVAPSPSPSPSDPDTHPNTTSSGPQPHADETTWTKSCTRCGLPGGFTIRESELEAAEARGEGEVVVGCGGCSLWVRVGFASVED